MTRKYFLPVALPLLVLTSIAFAEVDSDGGGNIHEPQKLSELGNDAVIERFISCVN